MSFSASVVFRGVDMLTAPVKNMERSVGGLSKSMGSLGGSIAALAGGISISAALYSGSKAAIQFDESIQSLKAITGLAGAEFMPFQDKIMEIGDATKKSYVDIAKAMELIGSAKPELLANADAMGKTTKAAILLSKASGMDLPTAAQSLTNALNQFGAGAEEATKYVDILSTSEQKGTATAPQLVEALINGGSAAKTLGVNFEDTNAILQGYAKAGVLGANAGTQMAAVLSKLAQSTNSKFNPASVGAVKALDNLANAQMSYAQLIKMFGPESAKFIATILNQNKVVQSLSGNLNDTGNAQKQADERSKAFTNRVKELTATFDNFFISGDKTSGALNVLGSVLNLITTNFGALLAVVGTVIGIYAIYKTAIAIQTAMLWANSVALDFQLLSQGYQGTLLIKNTATIYAYAAAMGVSNVATWIAATATAAWAAALQATGLPLLIGLIVAIVAAIVLLIMYWDECTDAVIDFGKMILSAVIDPLLWVLKIIGQLTGAKWAVSLESDLKGFQNNLDQSRSVKDEAKKESEKTSSTEKPVNKDADILTQKKIMETNNNQNIQLNIDDSTGRARIGGNTSVIPVRVNNTKGYGLPNN